MLSFIILRDDGDLVCIYKFLVLDTVNSLENGDSGELVVDRVFNQVDKKKEIT